MSEYLVKFSDFGHDMGLANPDPLNGWDAARTFGIQVTRCRDCKLWRESGSSHIMKCRMTEFPTEGTHFCSLGEPKEEA